MARTRRVAERDPGPAPGGQEASDTRAPRPVDERLHVAVRRQDSTGVMQGPEFAPWVCEGKRAPGQQVIEVLAPLDDPRFCPECLRGRPHSVGSAFRVSIILVRLLPERVDR